jgi:hypothetical protein
MRTFRLLSFMIFHWGVVVFALILLATTMAPMVGQVRENPEVEDLTRRVGNIESLNLDHRLTVIETLLNEVHGDHVPHLLTMGGTALLILERAVKAMSKRVQEEDGE